MYFQLELAEWQSIPYSPTFTFIRVPSGRGRRGISVYKCLQCLEFGAFNVDFKDVDECVIVLRH